MIRIRKFFAMCLWSAVAVLLGGGWGFYEVWCWHQAREQIKMKPNAGPEFLLAETKKDVLAEADRIARTPSTMDPSAAYSLAWRYNRAKDYARSYPLFLKAAEGGVVGAMCQMGWMCKMGKGTPTNLSASVKWYRLANEMGNVWGTYGLAEAFRYGLGVAPDPDKAYDLYLELAKKKLPVSIAACAAIARMFENGIGRDKNLETAKDWYRKALTVSKEKDMFGIYDGAKRSLERLEKESLPCQGKN